MTKRRSSGKSKNNKQRGGGIVDSISQFWRWITGKQDVPSPTQGEIPPPEGEMEANPEVASEEPTVEEPTTEEPITVEESEEPVPAEKVIVPETEAAAAEADAQGIISKEPLAEVAPEVAPEPVTTETRPEENVKTPEPVKPLAALGGRTRRRRRTKRRQAKNRSARR